MNLFQFRTRNPDRDQQTDIARFNTLLKTLDTLKSDVEGEQTGLQRRYQKVSEMAALTLGAFENEGGESLSRKADKLTLTMASCNDRIATLQKHSAFLAEVRRNVLLFAGDIIPRSAKVHE